MRYGTIFRWGSCWVGWHWSRHNKRLCINLIPCLTLWIVWPGGNLPR